MADYIKYTCSRYVLPLLILGRWSNGNTPGNSEFIIVKVVKEDHHMLLANKLQSITYPDEVSQALSLAACDAFAII